MNLLNLEQEVSLFLLSKTNDNLKTLQEMLDFILHIYNKHNEIISVDEAYTILYT